MGTGTSNLELVKEGGKEGKRPLLDFNRILGEEKGLFT